MPDQPQNICDNCGTQILGKPCEAGDRKLCEDCFELQWEDWKDGGRLLGHSVQESEDAPTLQEGNVTFTNTPNQDNQPLKIEDIQDAFPLIEEPPKIIVHPLLEDMPLSIKTKGRLFISPSTWQAFLDSDEDEFQTQTLNLDAIEEAIERESPANFGCDYGTPQHFLIRFLRFHGNG